MRLDGTPNQRCKPPRTHNTYRERVIITKRPKNSTRNYPTHERCTRGIDNTSPPPQNASSINAALDDHRIPCYNAYNAPQTRNTRHDPTSHTNEWRIPLRPRLYTRS